MTHSTRAGKALAGLVMASAPILLVLNPAVADHGTKAAIEHAERQSVATTSPNKAQIERLERQQQTRGAQQKPSVLDPGPGGGGGDAAAWQLALSAAVGAALTGGAVVAARQVSQHRHAVAH